MQATPAHATQPTPVAELVVLTGRLAGTRRPVQNHLTFVGCAAGCDVRLDVDGIQPLHCLLVSGPRGLLVRDLETAQGTFVNGERVTVCPVQDGDVLSLGALQVRLIFAAAEPAATPGVSDAPALEAERDAVRVQAAAVAAQQAALVEQEARLQQQQATLTRQQEQLAGHLEEKRQRLEQMSEQMQATRLAMKQKHDEQAEVHARQQEELACCRVELEAERKKLKSDRQRLIALRGRLAQRFQRRLAAERQQIHQREKEMAADQLRLEQEARQLQQDRDALTQARLSFNGDVELGKRQLQADRQKLWEEQKQWTTQRTRQEAELAGRVRGVRKREQALADAERSLGDDRYEWEQRRKLVEQEVYGLEARINNQRRKLLEQQHEITRAESRMRDLQSQETPVVAVRVDEAAGPGAVAARIAPPQVLTAAQDEELQRRAAQLDEVAGQLADQRLLLLEHWQQLVTVYQLWDEEHQAATDQLAALTVGLPEQEQLLLRRERGLEEAEDDLQQSQRELSQQRLHLEGWAAGVRLRETAWEAERDRLLADLQHREALAETHLTALVGMRQRWTRQRKQELEQLKTERRTCEKLRQEYATLRQECWQRSQTLDQQLREASEKSLALEEYRQQFVLRAQDAAAVEHKLERMRKRWVQHNAQLVRATAEQFHRLHTEATHIQQRGRELLKVAEDLTEREAAMVRRQVTWEEQITRAEAEQARLRQQLLSTQAQRERSERHIADLEAEVQSMARVLLDEVIEPPRPEAQAA
jgi:hypothetical protein